MKLYKIKDLGDDTYLSNYNAKDYPNNDLMPINENKFKETFTKKEVREKIIDYLWFEDMEMDYKKVKRETKDYTTEELAKIVNYKIEEVI